VTGRSRPDNEDKHFEQILSGVSIATSSRSPCLPHSLSQIAKPANERNVEEWTDFLRQRLIAFEKEGSDGGLRLEADVRKSVADGTSTPEMLKAFHTVSRQARAAKLAETLMRADLRAREERAEKAAAELL